MKRGKQSSFPVNTARPVQALSTLAPDMFPVDTLAAGSGRRYRDAEAVRVGREQEGRLGWEREEVGVRACSPQLWTKGQRCEMGSLRGRGHTAEAPSREVGGKEYASPKKAHQAWASGGKCGQD